MTESEAQAVRSDVTGHPGMRAFVEHVVPGNPHGYAVRVTLAGGNQIVLATPERAREFLRRQLGEEVPS